MKNEKLKILKLLFLALFVTFSFGQLAKLPLNIPGVNIYLHDIILTLILLFWLGWHIGKKEKFLWPPLAKPIFLFTSVALFSLLFNVSKYQAKEVFVGSLYLLRWIAYGGVYFVVWEMRKNRRFFAKGLLFAGAICAIFGLLQYIFIPDTRFLYYSGWDDHYFRVIAPFLDPGFTGMIYCLTLILLANTYWKEFSKRKSLLTTHYSLFTILYLALMLTYSRSAYLAYLLGMEIIAFKRRAPKLFIIIFLVFLVTLFLLPRPSSEGVKLERKVTAVARISNWQQAFQIIKDHPLLGIGFNLYRYAQRNRGFLGKDWQTSHSGAGADNSFLFILATTGIVGLIAYLWFCYSLLTTHYSLLTLASFLSLFAHSFFNNSLFYSWIMLWMWILLGLSKKKS